MVEPMKYMAGKKARQQMLISVFDLVLRAAFMIVTGLMMRDRVSLIDAAMIGGSRSDEPEAMAGEMRKTA